MSQLLFQAIGAIAGITGPGFGSIVVAALAAVVRVLNACEVEVAFSVGALLLQRLCAIANFHPTHGAIVTQARGVQVAKIFAASNGAAPERAVFESRAAKAPVAPIECVREPDISS